MRVLLILIAVITAYAPALAVAETLSGAVNAAFEDDEKGLALLEANGVLKQIAGVERLPSGAYLVEVSFQLGEMLVRYPLKMTRDGASWTVAWSPDSAYASALISMSRHRALPTGTSDTRWSETPRLPALPVIITRQRTITAFGAFDTPAPAQALTESAELQRAANAWVSNVLDADPGPAALDIIVDARLDWQQLNAALYNLAAVGLYQVNLVMTGGSVLPVAAPVRQAAYIVAISKLDDAWGVRIVLDGAPLPESSCAPQMTACIKDADALKALLESHPPSTGPLMVAAGPGVSVGNILPFIRAVQQNTGVGPHHLLLGYVAP